MRVHKYSSISEWYFNKVILLEMLNNIVKIYTLLGQFLNLKFLIFYQGNHLVLHLISRNQLKPK